MRERDVLWTPSTGAGLEHLRLTQDQTGYFASSVVIGTKYGQPFSAWYVIRCDANWRVQQVNVTTLHTGNKRVELLAQSEGHWQVIVWSTAPRTRRLHRCRYLGHTLYQHAPHPASRAQPRSIR